MQKHSALGAVPQTLPGTGNQYHASAAEVNACRACSGKPEQIQSTYRTQKARGIKSLGMFGSAGRFRTSAVNSADVWPYTTTLTNYPVFARPCPTVPRHGFVESRIVRNKAEWLALLHETLAVEPNAEVVIMPFLEPEWSGILTPSGLAVGPGHDGATSGKGVMSIPTPSTDKSSFSKYFGLRLDHAGVKTYPYVELVATKTNIQAVQLRDGPVVELADRFVPKEMVVAAVAKAEGDLLEWETACTKFAPGTVVWHPGGALSSHYAVHCVINQIPVLCTDKAPVVGETLAPAGPPVLTVEDCRKIAAYIISYDSWAQMVLSTKYDAEGVAVEGALLATGTLHAQAAWGGEDHLLRLRAAGAALVVRMASAAVLGELRHYNRRGPGATKKRKMLTQDLAGVQVSKDAQRNQVYLAAFSNSHDVLCKMLVTAALDYETPGWGGSYGGKKWAACAHRTLKMTRALSHFIQNPNPKNWALFVKQWNGVIHVAHNGGYFLNKFMDQSCFNVVAQVPSFGLTTSLLKDVLFTPRETVPLKQARKVARAWREAAKARTKSGGDLLAEAKAAVREAEKAARKVKKAKAKTYNVKKCDYCKALMPASGGSYCVDCMALAAYKAPAPAYKAPAPAYKAPAPAYKAPAPTTMNGTYIAQAKVVQNMLHIQVELATPKNRPYGWSISTTGKLTNVKAWLGLTKTRPSLNETGLPGVVTYFPVVITVQDGAITVKYVGKDDSSLTYSATYQEC